MKGFIKLKDGVFYTPSYYKGELIVSNSPTCVEVLEHFLSHKSQLWHEINQPKIVIEKVVVTYE